jgi:hypothetical protein
MKRTLFDDTYLAGLWKNHIVNQLLWMTYKNLNKGYPKKYRAPSWSWASDILEADEQTILAEVLEAHVVTREEKAGEVTDGWLSIKGKLLPAEWHRTLEWGQAAAEADGEEDPCLKPFSDENPAPTPKSKWATHATKDMFFFENGKKPTGMTGFPGIHDKFFQGKSFCFAIQTCEPPEDEPEKRYVSLVEGLVLVPSKEK